MVIDMTGKQLIFHLIESLENIPLPHDGLGKTASVTGALAYQADMREMLIALRELKYLIIEGGINNDATIEHVGAIVAMSQIKKQRALSGKTAVDFGESDQ